MTTLDDLLTAEREDAPPRRRRPRVRWLVLATLAAAALAGAAVAVLRMIGYELSFPVAVASILALLALHRLVRGLDCRAQVGRSGGVLERAPERDEPDQLVVAVARWQTRLSAGRAGIRPFARTSPLLAELVGERLRLRHGLTLDSDPVRARTLLGERLWAYLADPAAATPSPRELAALLTDVEKL